MPFEPGRSGNPGGRPKRDKIITQHLISELGEIDPETGGEKIRRIVVALIDKAMAGDVSATREIMDRVEGKVTTILGNDPESPLIPPPSPSEARGSSTLEWLQGVIEQGRKKQEEQDAALFKWKQENPQATAEQFVEQATKISREHLAR